MRTADAEDSTRSTISPSLKQTTDHKMFRPVSAHEEGSRNNVAFTNGDLLIRCDDLLKTKFCNQIWMIADRHLLVKFVVTRKLPSGVYEYTRTNMVNVLII
ncbi:hypothetical protein Tcan_03262 [Toxocara canis]|uniref:Uncharacterized protein n=1 Tax=Toxocara canis TaxID=6265 RepID=A0A0B2V9S6_TOXCA|nr:hypothetical protein Tcan_03262 [Toxocara canis]